MSYVRKNVELVNKEYEEKRARAKAIQSEHILQVYSVCPEIQEIDKELSRVGLEIFAVAMGDKDNFDNALKQVRQKNEELLARRCFLLKKHGFDADYTSLKYECDKCNDTGYTEKGLCPCYKHALTLKGYESSGIANLLKKQSFESFSLDMYPSEAKELIEKNYRELKSFVDSFDTKKTSYLLVGGTGLGKTHHSTSVAKELVDKGYYVVYEIAQNIFADFEQDYFRDRYHDTEMVSNKYLECDLLIIDDLGTEIVTKRSLSYLYNVVNTRLNKNLPIIISTNLKGKEIADAYDERITSRLFGEFCILKFEGIDVRKTKVKK